MRRKRLISGEWFDIITAADRRRFITALMTTLSVCGFAIGVWYIYGTNAVQGEAEAAFGIFAEGGGYVYAYELLSCLRDCARGIAPYFVFVIDLFIFICTSISECIV